MALLSKCSLLNKGANSAFCHRPVAGRLIFALKSLRVCNLDGQIWMQIFFKADQFIHPSFALATLSMSIKLITEILFVASFNATIEILFKRGNASTFNILA